MKIDENAIEASARCDSLPEFGRCADVQRLFGIRRGKLYELMNSGAIRSVSLRQPGRKFGLRLIHLASVRDYLTGLMNAQLNCKSRSMGTADTRAERESI